MEITASTNTPTRPGIRVTTHYPHAPASVGVYNDAISKRQPEIGRNPEDAVRTRLITQKIG